MNNQKQVAEAIILQPLNERFSICQVEDFVNFEMAHPFCFICQTDAEKSLVCPMDLVPDRVVNRNDGWKCFHIAGKLDFSFIGIVAGISTILASNEIGLFVISTYNTDYIFTKEVVFSKALNLLEEDGYIIKADH